MLSGGLLYSAPPPWGFKRGDTRRNIKYLFESDPWLRYKRTDVGRRIEFGELSDYFQGFSFLILVVGSKSG